MARLPEAHKSPLAGSWERYSQAEHTHLLVRVECTERASHTDSHNKGWDSRRRAVAAVGNRNRNRRAVAYYNL